MDLNSLRLLAGSFVVHATTSLGRLACRMPYGFDGDLPNACGRQWPQASSWAPTLPRIMRTAPIWLCWYKLMGTLVAKRPRTAKLAGVYARPKPTAPTARLSFFPKKASDL